MDGDVRPARRNMSPPARKTPTPSLREVRMRINLPHPAGWSSHMFKPPTIAEVAAQAGVTQPHISGIELGRHRASEYLLWELARIYGVSPDLMRAAQAETLRRVKRGEPQIKTEL